MAQNTNGYETTFDATMAGALPRASLSRSQPPADSYDNHQDLVPPHFSVTPALTGVKTTYTYYGNPHQAERWTAIAYQARSQAREIYRKHNLSYNPYYKVGLYIAGSELQVSNPTRDRMMILVFELRSEELGRWISIQPDAVNLLNRLGFTKDCGVCVRYYCRPERIAEDPPPYLVIAEDDEFGRELQSDGGPRPDYHAEWQAEQRRTQQYNQDVTLASLMERAGLLASSHRNVSSAAAVTATPRGVVDSTAEQDRSLSLPIPPVTMSIPLQSSEVTSSILWDPELNLPVSARSPSGPLQGNELTGSVGHYFEPDPPRRDREDSGWEFVNQDVAVSDEEKELERLARPTLPGPAIEYR